MDLRRIKWVAILAPIGFIGVLEYARYAFSEVQGSWIGHLLMDGAALLGAVFLYGAVFTVIDNMRVRLERQNRELTALRSAGLDIAAELSLDVVLRKVVDQACGLVGTLYGALAMYDDRDQIQHFVTCGISDEELAQIEPPPRGRGLLGIVLREGQSLRISNILEDPRFTGFPDNHPDMHSLLAVPVTCRGPFRGNLYLSEKADGSEFDEEDEETLVRFASQAAIAVDNAHLHAQVGSLAVAEERLRLAHEMHDGQAQVLAYVNTKAQVVQEYLRSGRIEEATEHLRQLAAAAREVYADVREGILGLRAIVDSENGLCDALKNHVEHWQDQCGIPVELKLDEVPRFTADVELQLLRILQESLANVRKHSEAGKAKVEVKIKSSGVQFTVEDDGTGFDPAGFSRSRKPRFGLATMRERAEAIGATFNVRSQAGAGTRIDVEYPVAR